MLWLLFFVSFTASAQCCYNPEPVDLFEIPHKKYNFEFEFKEPNQNFKIFVLLNLVDAYITHKALKNPRVWEGNPILGNKPTLSRIIIQKSVGTYYVHRYVQGSDLKMLNKAMLIVVANNLEVLDRVNKSSNL